MDCNHTGMSQLLKCGNVVCFISDIPQDLMDETNGHYIKVYSVGRDS